MSRVTCQISISLDGYVAGPDQTAEEPLGKEGGTTFHFVNDGFGSALEQARAAAASRTSASPAARTRSTRR